MMLDYVVDVLVYDNWWRIIYFVKNNHLLRKIPVFFTLLAAE